MTRRYPPLFALLFSLLLLLTCCVSAAQEKGQIEPVSSAPLMSIFYAGNSTGHYEPCPT